MNRTHRFVYTVIAVALLGSVLGTRPAPAGEDWLPISPEDLTLKDNPASPGANAMILYREDVISARNSTDDEYLRIKIFTQEGAQREGDVSIPFDPSQGKVQNIRARTIRPDGTIVNFDGKTFEKVLVKANGLKYLAKTFSFPEVRPGCIVEYKYRKQYDPQFYWSIEWTVQGDIFTRLGHFSIMPSKEEGAPALYYRQYGLPENVSPKKQPDGSLMLEVHDLKGLEIEDYMPPDEALRARVSFFYKDRSAPTNETMEQFWKRMAKEWNDTANNFVNKKSVLEGEVRRISNPEDAPDVKLQKIYARVRQVRNLSFEDSKSKKEVNAERLKSNSNVEDVLKHGYGTGRDINFLFLGLVRAAGYSSSEVYLAPRNVTGFSPELEDPRQLTADVVWVRAGNLETFLDPASAFQPYGTLPWPETSTKGVRAIDGQFVTTPTPTSADATVIRHSDLELNEEGAATGKLTVDFTGMRAASWREDYRNEDEAGRRKELTEGIQSWLPSGSTFEVTEVSNWDKLTEPLHVEGTVKIPGLGSVAGHRLLVPATIFHAPYAKAFVSEKRVNMVYFRIPFEETDDVKFHAPAGFKIETTPPTKRITPGAVSYEISATQDGAAAEVKRHLVVNVMLVPVQTYPALRSFFAGVNSNDESQIVLRNAESASNH